MTTITEDRQQRLNPGMALKVPCKVATTGNIALAGEQTIDGVACVTNDRVLVKNQTNQVDNGIYIVSTGNWSRASDFDGVYDATLGTLLIVTGGSSLGRFFRLTTSDSPVVFGTSAITFQLSTEVPISLDSFIQIVDTIAGLKALANPGGASPTIFVRGYFAVNDGGGGLFRWNQADATADNGGTVIAPNAGTGRWNRILEGLSVPAIWFGAGLGTATANTAALQAAIAAANDITVPPGTYDNFTISTASKTLRMEQGVTIKLPNGTVPALAVTGPPVLGISGANITIIGDFTIDGNRANNNAASFPTSRQGGSLWVSGNNCRLQGTVTINEAYWRGFSVQNGDNSGSEVDTFWADCIKVSNPFSYAVMFWTVKNFHVNRIEVSRGTNLDARVRFGSQSASTGEVVDGYVGAVKSDSSVVFEANASKLEVDFISCAVGKYQDAHDCRVGYWISDYTSGYTQDQVDGNGIAFISALRCHIDVARVTRFNCTTESCFAVGGGGAASATQDCSVGALFVDGTIHAVTDCRIITTDGFDFGTINLKSSIALGFLFDTGPDTLVPQRRITIGSLVSIGHTTDVTIESAGASRAEQIKIDYINPDAVIATGGGESPFGPFTWANATNSIAVTNGFVTAASIIHIDPVDAAAGVVMAAKGYYITKVAGTFTVHTGDGTNIAGPANFTYHIVSQYTPTA